MKKPDKVLSPYSVNHYSHRGHQLLWNRELPEVPTITVENYDKWYGLMLIDKVNGIQEIPFPMDVIDCRPGLSPFIDHDPNPKVVENFATRMHYDVHEVALELMEGRWWNATGRGPSVHGLSLKASEPKAGSNRITVEEDEILQIVLEDVEDKQGPFRGNFHAQVEVDIHDYKVRVHVDVET